MKKPTLPDVFANLPPDTSLSAKDLSGIYGIGADHLIDAIKKGLIPEPDWKHRREGRKPTRMWKMSTIRNHIAQQKS